MRLRSVVQVLAVAVTSLGACAAVSLAPSAVGGAAAPPCGAPVPRPGGGHWACTFDDEFGGSQLDPGKWTALTSAEVGMNGGSTCYRNSPQNISVGRGVLSLTARRLSYASACQIPHGTVSTRYTGGDVATTNKFSQKYGRFSVRARFPRSTMAGLHSALWLWPQDNLSTGLTGEIDIAEEYSVYADRAVPYLHYPYTEASVDRSTNTNIVTNNFCMINNVNAFHVYTAEWTPTRITITYDGVPCLVDNYLPDGPSPFAQRFFVALTQTFGIGVNAPTPQTRSTASMEVDWVRVWA